MDERLKLTQEKKEQLLFRVKEALFEKDMLDMTDWMKIYDVLLNACQREEAEVYERYMEESLKGGDAK